MRHNDRKQQRKKAGSYEANVTDRKWLVAGNRLPCAWRENSNALRTVCSNVAGKSASCPTQPRTHTPLPFPSQPLTYATSAHRSAAPHATDARVWVAGKRASCSGANASFTAMLFISIVVGFQGAPRLRSWQFLGKRIGAVCTSECCAV